MIARDVSEQKQTRKLNALPISSSRGASLASLILSLMLAFFANSFVTAQTDESASNSVVGDSNSAIEQPHDSKPANVVYFKNRTLKLNIDDWPLYGNKDAEHIFIGMFDYASPDNKLLHQKLTEAKNILKNDMAIVVLPVPQNAKCNPLAGRTELQYKESCDLAILSMAIWRCSPKNFDNFHNWMMSRTATPTFAEAKLYGQSLVGIKSLDEMLKTTSPARLITESTQTYAQVGGGAIPKLLFPMRTLSGEVGSARSLANAIKTETGK